MLQIKKVPEIVNFHIGELSVIQSPGLKFSGFNRVASKIFIEETIRYAIENLLINDVLICHTQTTVIPYLRFFKHVILKDYFILNKSLPPDLGVVESSIMNTVSRDEPMGNEMFIARLISEIIDKPGKTHNPWEEVFRRIINKNKIAAWSVRHKNFFWEGETLEITLNPLAIKNSSVIKNKVADQCCYERNNNVDFAALSNRLEKLIQKVFSWNELDTEGGS